MEVQALKEKFERQLSKFVPEGSEKILASWIIELNFDLVISHERKSKFGDFRHAHGGKRSRISVNHNLNPYAFLVTFVHEVAHLTSFKKHGMRIRPHGSEWKQEFRIAMRPFIVQKIFPVKLEQALEEYLQNPAASSCSDDNLFRVLKSFDAPHTAYVHVEDLPEGAVFISSGGRFFTKGPKMRKRYRCEEHKSGHTYLFSPIAEVIPQERQSKSDKVELSELSEGSVFFDPGGKAYRKIEPFGSGFKCTDMGSGKAYLFKSDTRVLPKKD